LIWWFNNSNLRADLIVHRSVSFVRREYAQV
jgi:hypothetical protein